jgi:hypothetical protein
MVILLSFDLILGLEMLKPKYQLPVLYVNARVHQRLTTIIPCGTQVTYLGTCFMVQLGTGTVSI